MQGVRRKEDRRLVPLTPARRIGIVAAATVSTATSAVATSTTRGRSVGVLLWWLGGRELRRDGPGEELLKGGGVGDAGGYWGRSTKGRGELRAKGRGGREGSDRMLGRGLVAAVARGRETATAATVGMATIAAVTATISTIAATIATVAATATPTITGIVAAVPVRVGLVAATVALRVGVVARLVVAIALVRG